MRAYCSPCEDAVVLLRVCVEVREHLPPRCRHFLCGAQAAGVAAVRVAKGGILQLSHDGTQLGGGVLA